MKKTPRILAFATVSAALAQAQPALRLDGASGPGLATSVTLTADQGGYTLQSAPSPAGPWTDQRILTLGNEGTAQRTLTAPAAPKWFVRARQDEVSDEVWFQTGGANFQPLVACAGGLEAVVLWNWAGGGTSTAYPAGAASFGSEGTRLQRLRLFGANRLTTINLGFDGADGGWSTPMAVQNGQSVTAVTFPHPLTQLQCWGSSYNPGLTSLDFTGFTSLQYIECYACSNLRQVAVKNLPALKRACFEDCDLLALDLSGCPNLEDLRGALNAYTSITVGNGTGPMVWHWCTRDNPQLTQRFSDIMGNFTALRELYIWNDNQDGTLTVGSHVLADVAAYGNRFSGADLSDQPQMWNCQLNDNQLTSISLTGCNQLVQLNLRNNLLPPAVLDAVLATLDTDAPLLVFADLSGNAGTPTAAGLAHYANLVARGAGVVIDLPETNDGRLEVAGGAKAITFVTTSRDPHLEIRTNSPTATVIWHFGDGTVNTGGRVVHHDFGSVGEHTNYVEVDPPSAVTYFGAQRDRTGQGLKRVLGANHFPNLDFLFLYQESLVELSIAGCANLRQLHFADNPVSPAVCDQWFLDLDAAVAGPVTGADFFFPSAARTSASDAAYASLVAKGFVMWPF